jgi:site-specific DNA-methyltransferase (adenine-specific)
MASKLDAHFSSKRDDHGTPADFYKRLDAEFGFTLDVCGTELNHKHPNYIRPAWHVPCGPISLAQISAAYAVDGLASPWSSDVCFMNPPYGRQIGQWTSKARIEAFLGATVVGLLPSRTDTAYWHRDVMRAHELRLVKGRLKFQGSKNGAPFPSAVVVWRPGTRKGPLVIRAMEARI